MAHGSLEGRATMPRQESLDFRRERLGTLWSRMPKPWRDEVVAIYARLIARAAQRPREARQQRGAER